MRAVSTAFLGSIFGWHGQRGVGTGSYALAGDQGAGLDVAAATSQPPLQPPLWLSLFMAQRRAVPGSSSSRRSQGPLRLVRGAWLPVKGFRRGRVRAGRLSYAALVGWRT